MEFKDAQEGLEQFNRRIAIAGGFVLLCFAVLFGRFVWLQVVQHDYYQTRAEDNRISLVPITPNRGLILDRNGEILARNYSAYTLEITPTQVPDLEATLDGLAEFVDIQPKDRKRFKKLMEESKRFESLPIRTRLSDQEVAKFVARRFRFPGVDIKARLFRQYPRGAFASHVLGYIGRVTERDLGRIEDWEEGVNYRGTDHFGKSGLEQHYERDLHGTSGFEQVEVDAGGRPVRTLARVAPVPGNNLTLTLDAKLQEIAEKAFGERRGALVAIEPATGGILALVSRPAYDPNEFSHGLSRARWRELSEGGANPLLNRAIQGVYPPGSTFKIVTTTAALLHGLARPGTRLAPCGGGMTYGGRRFACWEHRGHGSLDLLGALQHSCDVYFYQLGLRLGLEKLGQTARAFGLGARTGVDLPQEARGLIPSAEYYDRRWGPGRWRSGLLLNLAIGQGELLLTPLQMALVAAQVAGGGRPLRPHLVERVGRAGVFRPERPVQTGFAADPAVWGPVHEALELAVTAGTGGAARVPGGRVAGKTGTAQNPHGQDHALFVCYAPADSPRVAVAVVVENAGHGGSVAAPRAGALLRSMFLPDSLRRPPARRGPRDTAQVAAPDTQEVAGD